MRVFVVRHAHAGDREEWRGDDSLRPLSKKGWAQARGLVGLLQDDEIGRLMSSPYLRCVQTLEPLAEIRGLPLEAVDFLAEGSDWRTTLECALEAAVPTVMCSQGDVIGDLVMHLVELGLVATSDARWPKGSTWVLEIESGRVAGARFLAPPAV